MELTCIMEKEFDLQQYITTGVERFVSSALKATFKNPRESAFLAKFAVSAKKAAALEDTGKTRERFFRRHGGKRDK